MLFVRSLLSIIIELLVLLCGVIVNEEGSDVNVDVIIVCFCCCCGVEEDEKRTSSPICSAFRLNHHRLCLRVRSGKSVHSRGLSVLVCFAVCLWNAFSTISSPLSLLSRSQVPPFTELLIFDGGCDKVLNNAISVCSSRCSRPAR